MDNANNDTISQIIITDNMLPDLLFYDQKIRKDITINAYFVCDDRPINNPLLRNNNAGIDTLDIEVKYHGNTDIAINYLRLMTKQAEKYIAGSGINELRTKFQDLIQLAESKGYEIYGVYGRDEMTEEYFTFQRYLSSYFNFCTVSEGAGGDYPFHYMYHVQPHKVWIGALNFKNWARAPYYFNHLYTNPDENLRFFYRLQYPNLGYDDYINSNPLKNYNSEYETDIGFTNNSTTTNTHESFWRTLRYDNIDTIYFQGNWSGAKRNYGIEMYKDMVINSNALGMYEIVNYRNFYENDYYLYSGQPWWSNNYPTGNWNLKSKEVIEDGILTTKYFATIGNGRPQTGEEIRLLLWAQLLFGSKGFAYDCWNDSLDIPRRYENRTMGFLTGWDLDKFENTNPNEMIFGEEPAFGVDFIPNPDSSTLIHKFMDFPNAAISLGVPENRIYYGRKSPKIEMYYLHTVAQGYKQK